MPLKYWNSLNDTIVVFPLNTVPIDTIVAASWYDNSLSWSVSQLRQQSFFTSKSLNWINSVDCPVFEIVITVPSANSK